MEDAGEAARFEERGVPRLHLVEELHGVGLQDGELVVEGRVEDGVRPVLVGVDPLTLAGDDVRPEGEGLERRAAPEVVVAHEAPQEARVRGGEAVAGIEHELGERVEVDAELQLVRDAAREVRVERVDAFEHHDARGVHLRLRLGVGTVVPEEVELPQVDRPAGEERVQVGGEARGVHGVHGLVVEVPVRVARVARIAHEVVVGGQEDGAQTVHAQLRAEAVGRRRLAGGGGAGEEDEPHRRLARRDLVRDARKVFRLQGLDGAHEDVEAAVQDDLVQVADRLDARDGRAGALAAEHLEIGLDVGKRLHHVRVLGGGDVEDEAVVHGHELVGPHRARAGRERRLAERAEVAAAGKRHDGRIAVPQQVDLVHAAQALEERHGVPVGNGLNGNREVGRLERGHRGAKARHERRRVQRLRGRPVRVPFGFQRTPKRGADGMPHAERPAREELVRALREHEDERIAVNLETLRVGARERPQRRRADQRRRERHDHVVRDGRQDGTPRRIGLRQGLSNCPQFRPFHHALLHVEGGIIAKARHGRRTVISSSGEGTVW